MKIKLPSIDEQKKIAYEEGTQEAIKILRDNLKMPHLPPQEAVDESLYSDAHLKKEDKGWESPAPEIVTAYFKHFQYYFPDYDTDKKLAWLLGINSSNADRRIRAFKKGEKKVPYGIWRRFLIITGRVPNDVHKVFAFM